MSINRFSRHSTTSGNNDFIKFQKELFESATKGKLPQFKANLLTLLKTKSMEDIFQPKDNKGSPLILAAQKGQYKIVSYILKNFVKEIDIEYSMTIKSEFTGHEVAGATALWCAALGGHFDVVRELVAAGADINHPNGTNSTPLRAASYHNRVEVITYLLSQGADISITNHVGQAPVMISVLRENEEALRALVTYGKADLSQTTAAGIDSLHITIERESNQIFNLLLSLGAKVIWPNSDPSPSPCYYNVPEVYQPPCHIFVAAKCHNAYAMEYLSKSAECTRECEVDMWLVRGIERVWDYPSQNVTEAWRKALELRDNYNLAYPGLPPIDLYERIAEIRMLNDVYNISQKNYLIQCVLISERVFGPLYCTSCDIKIKLVNHLFREGSDNHWKCCELLYQLLQAVVKRSWMPTQASIIEFNVLIQLVNNLVPAFSSEVMTMERFSQYVKCIYTRYDILLKGIGQKVSFDKSLNHLLTFLDLWLKKFEGLTTVESLVHRNPIFIEGLRIIFHPLTRDEPIYHSIMRSKNFLKYEHVLNAFISLSTPEMLAISNKDGLNALHFACKLETFPESVIHTLIHSGAHLDSVNPSNQAPIESCNKLSTQYLALRSYYPLKLVCLTARTIVQHQLPTDTLPAFFHNFITLHRKPWQKFNE